MPCLHARRLGHLVQRAASSSPLGGSVAWRPERPTGARRRSGSSTGSSTTTTRACWGWSSTRATGPADSGEGPALVVYPARGSHASLPRAGSFEAPVVPDHNDGFGPRMRPALTAIADDGPGWGCCGRGGGVRPGAASSSRPTAPVAPATTPNGGIRPSSTARRGRWAERSRMGDKSPRRRERGAGVAARGAAGGGAGCGGALRVGGSGRASRCERRSRGSPATPNSRRCAPVAGREGRSPRPGQR
jgi:hypothetical protein